ncbi:MAG: hypothetical protein ACOY42_02085 [Pseudomonadota bacterium]
MTLLAALRSMLMLTALVLGGLLFSCYPLPAGGIATTAREDRAEARPT